MEEVKLAIKPYYQKKDITKEGMNKISRGQARSFQSLKLWHLDAKSLAVPLSLLGVYCLYNLSCKTDVKHYFTPHFFCIIKKPLLISFS